MDGGGNGTMPRSFFVASRKQLSGPNMGDATRSWSLGLGSRGFSQRTTNRFGICCEKQYMYIPDLMYTKQVFFRWAARNLYIYIFYFFSGGICFYGIDIPVIFFKKGEVHLLILLTIWEAKRARAIQGQGNVTTIFRQSHLPTEPKFDWPSLLSEQGRRPPRRWYLPP